MKFLKRFFALFNKPAVIDAHDVALKFNPKHTYNLHVNASGKLIYIDENFNSEVIGIIDWSDEAKKCLQINTSTIITDLSLKRSQHDV